MHITFENPHYLLTPLFCFLQVLDTEFKVGLKVQINFALYQFDLIFVFYLQNKIFNKSMDSNFWLWHLPVLSDMYHQSLNNEMASWCFPTYSFQKRKLKLLLLSPSTIIFHWFKNTEDHFIVCAMYSISSSGSC